LFRGTSVTEKEVEELKMNVGAYIETEGFLSTSVNEDCSENFVSNLMMFINVPVENLRGVFDNGFAHISDFSCYSSEKEVLINAFNVFQVLSF
jgi:hypothetical protein